MTGRRDHWSEDGPPELYNPEDERPPYCDVCSCCHSGVCFEEDPPDQVEDDDFDRDECEEETP